MAMKHPGVWEVDGVTWVAVRAMRATVRSHWPQGRPLRGTGRSTIKGLVKSGAIKTVRYPSGSRDWNKFPSYGGEPMTVVESLMCDMGTHTGSVHGWRCEHAAAMTEARWPTHTPTGSPAFVAALPDDPFDLPPPTSFLVGLK
jgi:hypothetical protein